MRGVEFRPYPPGTCREAWPSRNHSGARVTGVPGHGGRTRGRFPASDNGRVTAIRCDVEPIGTHLLVRVTGELSMVSAPRVRAALTKCLVEQPDSIVIDVAGMRVAEPRALSVFRAVSRQAVIWPGIPLLFAAPTPEIAELIVVSGEGRPAVFGSVEAALAAGPRQRMPVVSDMLLPAVGSASRAREVVTAACARWDLPYLTEPAVVIAGELVTNAAQHARTMMTLRLTLSRRYLLIAVRDGSTVEPKPPVTATGDPDAPRGLLLVDALAVRWGSHTTFDGKVVWATLSRPAR